MNIENIREFNRYYARILGLFNQRAYGLKYSFSEARIIEEIGMKPGCHSQYLVDYLKLDKGYLSRIISKLEQDEVLYRETNKCDSRIKSLYLTEKGESIFNEINGVTNKYLNHLLKDISEQDSKELIKAMTSIKTIIGDQYEK